MTSLISVQTLREKGPEAVKAKDIIDEYKAEHASNLSFICQTYALWGTDIQDQLIDIIMKRSAKEIAQIYDYTDGTLDCWDYCDDNIEYQHEYYQDKNYPQPWSDLLQEPESFTCKLAHRLLDDARYDVFILIIGIKQHMNHELADFYKQHRASDYQKFVDIYRDKVMEQKGQNQKDKIRRKKNKELKLLDEYITAYPNEAKALLNGLDVKTFLEAK